MSLMVVEVIDALSECEICEYSESITGKSIKV